MSECKHDFDKPEAKTHTVNCKLCGEEFFIDDYYFWLSAKERDQLKKENQQLIAKLGLISIAADEDNLAKVKELIPPSCADVVREMQAEAVDKELAELAKLIHYPECWDTMAYPTLLDALSEMAACAECDVARNQLRNPEQEKV